MSVNDFYNIVVNIVEMARTADDYGSWSESTTTIYSNLSCCIQPRRGSELLIRGKEQSEVTHVMYCAVIEMNPAWKVIYSGKQYDILDVRNTGMQNRFLTIDLKEIVA